VTVDKGKVVMAGKVRMFQKALQEITQRIPESTFKLGIAQLQCPQEANDLIEMIKQRFPQLEISNEILSPIVAAHLGPCVGIGFQWK
jgi:fatty acid-binding protein DegV